uniref:Putative glucose-methanol-choline (Gmc) oxidoreductase n=1 Tax=Schistosoma mansoni TaxID=6183 RepID=A0A3Q0KVF5_SCHMA
MYILFIRNGYRLYIDDEELNYDCIDDEQIIRKLQNTQYDFIIAGGGTAGSIIVRKLWDGFQKMQCKSSEQAKSCSSEGVTVNHKLFSISGDANICKITCSKYRPKILLLESGSKISWLTKKISDIPLLAPLLYGRGIDVIERTTSQISSALKLKENAILLPRGHVLGGTALLNAMIFSYGHPDDELLEEFLHSNEEFLSELFDKMEGCSLKPEAIRHLPYNQLIHAYFAKAFELQGLKVNSSSPGWSFEGLTIPMVFVRNAQRISSYSECLLPLIKQKFTDLTIVTEIQVEKILFKKGFQEDLSAYGVLVNYKNHSFTIKLKTNSIIDQQIWPKPEILLSVGTVKTPEILLRSGVGPSREYPVFNQEHKYTTLPVGENLHDHPMIGLICSVINGTTVTTKSLTLLEIFKYYWQGKGLLSQASALTSIGYYRTSYQKLEGDSRPDIQYTVISASPFEKDTFENLGNFNPSTWYQYMKDENSKDFENPIVLLISLLNPRSRGNITMEYDDSDQPTGNVKINPSYLCELSDVNRLVEGIIWIYKTMHYINEKIDKLNLREINKERQIVIKPHLPHFSECPEVPKATSLHCFEQAEFVEKLKIAIECLVKSITLSNYHLVGTCSMQLPSKNNSAVVDKNLKIIGVSNVRVGDASVISKIPTGNPASLIMAIGNQLAKYIIHENWQHLSLMMD